MLECCLSAWTQPRTRLLPLSVQKSAVQVCQVRTVLMETVQLLQSQFKNFLL